MLLAFHTVTAVLALVAGFPIFFSKKGTRFHKRWGKIYVVSMLSLCISSFWLTGTTPFTEGFDVFHILAIVSLVSVIGGVIPVLAWYRFPGWFEMHYFFMLYSYVGLVMALGSHFFEYLPGVPQGIRALLFWGLPYIVGTILIYRKRASFKAQFDGPASETG